MKIINKPNPKFLGLGLFGHKMFLIKNGHDGCKKSLPMQIPKKASYLGEIRHLGKVTGQNV
jgi:hypothetical protein